MSTQTKGQYKVTGWEENPYDALDGSTKLSKARITNTFEGDIEGDGTADYLMAYAGDAYANFVGLQRVAGSIAGRKGTFVLQTSGTFSDGVTRAEWFVVPGSATGQLTGLSGKGGYEALDSTTCDVTLDYDLK
jgi:hypothetical protein